MQILDQAADVLAAPGVLPLVIVQLVPVPVEQLMDRAAPALDRRARHSHLCELDVSPYTVKSAARPAGKRNLQHAPGWYSLQSPRAPCISMAPAV